MLPEGVVVDGFEDGHWMSIDVGVALHKGWASRIDLKPTESREIRWRSLVGRGPKADAVDRDLPLRVMIMSHHEGDIECNVAGEVYFDLIRE